MGLAPPLAGSAIAIEKAARSATGPVQVDPDSGVQIRVGKVTSVRTEGGRTRFRIDSCPFQPTNPTFFAIASDNPDKLDITRLLISAMIFDREVKVYNTSFGEDVDWCPGTRVIGDITVGTVRASD